MNDISLSPEVRQRLISELREFFHNEWDEDISDFKAAMALDFFLTQLAPQVYNQAIADAYGLMSGKIEELFTLEKRGR